MKKGTKYSEITFQLIRIGKRECCIDPTNINILGEFNWIRLNELLFKKNNEDIVVIADENEIEQGECYLLTYSIKYDGDDDGSWAEFDQLISSELVSTGWKS